MRYDERKATAKERILQSKQRCIGIFTANLDDEYQSALWHAMEQEAKKRNIGTISFIGSRLGSPIA
ncbi:MAG TPA: hypothetical protein DCR02_03420, partial [Sphaerochaeta sp.]|nr:hypothetical protein [Sphaerochaeta sp.]